MNKIVVIEVEELKTLIEEAVSKALSSTQQPAPTQGKGSKFLRGNGELAKYLKCSVGTVIRWKELGLIPFTQKGRLLLYDVDKVNEVLDSLSKNGGPTNTNKRFYLKRK